jgi:hypothetical protein
MRTGESHLLLLRVVTVRAEIWHELAAVTFLQLDSIIGALKIPVTVHNAGLYDYEQTFSYYNTKF